MALTNDEVKDIVSKSTPLSEPEQEQFVDYLSTVGNAIKYKEYISTSDNRKDPDEFIEEYNSIAKNIFQKNTPLNPAEEIISNTPMPTTTKKEGKELKEAKYEEMVRKMTLQNDRHGGISAGLTILFIVFNLGIFIASIILMLN